MLPNHVSPNHVSPNQLRRDDVRPSQPPRTPQSPSELGPLAPLLARHDVSEIMVNGPGPVWIERGGQIVRTEVEIDRSTLQVTIERIIGPLGLRVDRTAPFVDARLPDGSRVNIAAPPLAIDGPYLTIRRFRPRPFTLVDFCSDGSAELAAAAVRDRRSILVSGATGSGKTSLLGALAGHMLANERVITIEDAAELRLPGAHVVRLEARPANAEGVGEVSIRSLVRNALRMRPDRLIVGEVRGAEAFDMLQAMSTGHAGSMSTCHANSPTEALRRIETMALMSDVDLPLAVLRDQVAAAIDLVIHVERGPGNQRRIMSLFQPSLEPTWLYRRAA